MKSIQILMGDKARKKLQQEGFSAQAVDCIPGAAGGPKGLILQGLDRWLFGEVFNAEHLARRTEPLNLIGASIGAWRLAAASTANPLAGLKRLADQYCEAQRYRKGVTVPEITAVCAGMVDEIVQNEASAICQSPGKRLIIWVNRGKPPLHHSQQNRPKKRGFVAATLANGLNRDRLNRYFERWVFSNGGLPDWLRQPYDQIDAHAETLTAENLRAALLSSASIPFVLSPVDRIPNSSGAHFSGPFWDGGLTDYHLALPYHRTSGLVLYPHFGPKVIPGWLDKFARGRQAKPEWMSNVILVCPSPEFVDRLPARKIPDRSDFKRYGTDHDRRIAHWRAAISESERMAEELAQWLEKPIWSDVKTFK